MEAQSPEMTCLEQSELFAERGQFHDLPSKESRSPGMGFWPCSTESAPVPSPTSSLRPPRSAALPTRPVGLWGGGSQLPS